MSNADFSDERRFGNDERRFGVLFVCTGNICRSPTAAGVFRRHVVEAGLEHAIEIESAGTGDWHIGSCADERSVAAAQSRGYDLSEHRARQVERADFHRFDWIIAMDDGHRRQLARLAKPSEGHKVKIMMEFARRHPGQRDVPDPYYGGAEGFERVLDMLEDASAGLLEAVRERLK